MSSLAYSSFVLGRVASNNIWFTVELLSVNQSSTITSWDSSPVIMYSMQQCEFQAAITWGRRPNETMWAVFVPLPGYFEDISCSCLARYCNPSRSNSFFYRMSAFRTWICCWTCGLWYEEPKNMDDLLFSSYLSVIGVPAKSRRESLANEFTLILNSSIFLMRSFLSCWFASINFVNISWKRSNFLSILFSIIGFSFVFSIGLVGFISVVFRIGEKAASFRGWTLCFLTFWDINWNRGREIVALHYEKG